MGGAWAAINHYLKEKERGPDRVRTRLVARGAGTPEGDEDSQLTVWEDEQWVAQMLASLTPRQAQVMELAIDGVGASEIAKLLVEIRTQSDLCSQRPSSSSGRAAERSRSRQIPSPKRAQTMIESSGKLQTLRITPVMHHVLLAFLESPTLELYGLQVCKRTCYPSGTIYPSLLVWRKPGWLHFVGSDRSIH